MGDYVDPTRVFFDPPRLFDPGDFDPGAPGDHSIPAIQDWVEANPDRAGDVLAAEQARGRDARKSLVSWLQSRPG